MVLQFDEIMNRDKELRLNIPSNMASLNFSADSMKKVLNGELWWWENDDTKDLHLNRMVRFVESACRGLEAISGNSEGDNCFEDIINLNHLYNACPELAKIKEYELHATLIDYAENMKKLRNLDAELEHTIRSRLITLCHSIVEYTLQKANFLIN